MTAAGAFATTPASCTVNGESIVTVAPMVLPYTSDYTPTTIKAFGADSLQLP